MSNSKRNKKKFTRGIVHGGQAHLDDFLSICFALAYGVISYVTTDIFRRDPTPGELEDPNVLVLDVGGLHDPERGNFDHHQLSSDEEECAMSLLLRHLDAGVEAALRGATKWYPAAIAIDTKGPFAFAKANKMDPATIFALAGGLNAPMLAILETFAGSVPVDANLLKIMDEIGLSHVRYAKEIVEVTGRVAKSATALPISADMAGVVFVEDVKSSTLSAVIDGYRGPEGAEYAPAFAVLKDDRGEGLTLLRLRDDPRIDFNRLNAVENPHIAEVVFAHKGGFVAKVRTTDLTIVEAMVRYCLV